ncbi:hypothetical protein OH76DRAFT_1422342 [Lentinus brumalis]|uniref:Uncharacterized protein n=1 Tax=Lentinus brumalis TaxID=2498619 RepID=A0A371CRB9_9APHY|nr:hypothetical protein OH76DRAFT_1422342 [Polyporus brumalis]
MAHPSPQVWEPEEVDQPDELELEPWVTNELAKFTRRKDANACVFALGRLPIQDCGWTKKHELCYKAIPVDLQITGVIWDLNFSMKTGRTAEYDISVAFIRRGDKNALGELIHLFKPRQTIPNVLTAYAKMSRRGRMLKVQDSQRRIKPGKLMKTTNFCSLNTGDMVLLHTTVRIDDVGMLFFAITEIHLLARDVKLPPLGAWWSCPSYTPSYTYTLLHLFIMGCPPSWTPELCDIPEESWPHAGGMEPWRRGIDTFCPPGTVDGEGVEAYWAYWRSLGGGTARLTGEGQEVATQSMVYGCGELFGVDVSLLAATVTEAMRDGITTEEDYLVDMPALEKMDDEHIRDLPAPEDTNGQEAGHVSMECVPMSQAVPQDMGGDHGYKTISRLLELRMKGSKRRREEEEALIPAEYSRRRQDVSCPSDAPGFFMEDTTMEMVDEGGPSR